MSDGTTLPISRSEWVEFASNEWCEEANRYLQEQAALHPDALDGVEWSVTERWQNAPPHLGFHGNIAGFWFTISGGKIEVGPGPAAEADTEIDGDYNSILPIGWTIYDGDAAIQARAQREYGHLSRDKPVKMKGQFPSHPPLLPFLGGLHDHMARRTINNPDVDHRIEHYGLRSSVEELDGQGYTVLESAFTHVMADELIENAGVGRHWEEMVVHPWVLPLVDRALGDDAVLIEPNRGTANSDALTAVWMLMDDENAGLEKGNIYISRGVPNAAVPAQGLQVSYGSAMSGLARMSVEISDEALALNPPVFQTLCAS